MTEPAKTVEQALALVASIAEAGAGTTRELAGRLRLNRTVTHRLLVTLERRGYVRRGADGWQLGLALAALGQLVHRDVREVARPALERLSRSCGETALLSVPDGTEAVALDQVVATAQQVQVRYRPGYRHPLARGAHGLAILAFIDAAVVDDVLASAADAAHVRDRLAQVRRQGYAFTTDELQFGASGVAAPVFDGPGGAVCASVGVVAPMERFAAEAAALETTVAADEITRGLALPSPAGPAPTPTARPPVS